MKIKEIGKKAIVPLTSAVVGGAVVIAVLKLSPSAMAKVRGELSREPHDQQVFGDIFERQESIRRQFDSLLNDDFAIGFNSLYKNGHRSNPFDAWFSDKSSEEAVHDIAKREDDNFVYYDIKVDDVNAASINTTVENGYVSISGTEEKKSKFEAQDGESATQSLFKSSFKRTFPLPPNVDQSKMQMLTEKNKVVLKFPKIQV